MKIDINMINLGIIIFTVIFSITAFGNEEKISKFSFYPYQIKRYREHYRFLSHAFVHADPMHLIFNMYGLYIFGGLVEHHLVTHPKFGHAVGEVIYLVFYSTAIYAASIPQFFKHKDNSGYSSIGASGAVNAIVFAFILIRPNAGMSLIFIPIPGGIPAWIFGLLYLGISYLLSRRKSGSRYVDMIDHSAHFWGALYGIIFMVIIEPSLIPAFFDKIIR